VKKLVVAQATNDALALGEDMKSAFYRMAGALPALVLALLLPLGAWAWTGAGHFVLDSIGYTDGTHARAYTVAPNFRQASGSLNQANSAISSADAADVYVNFDSDTSGKNVWVVYTTDGSAPNKGNGTSVAAAFSKYADPNRTWYATIPAQAVGVTVNYVFYISDSSDLASAWGRISGANADRNISQYETDWGENDGDYFTYGVCGKAITVTSAADSGAGSLRQAIADVCPGGSIAFNGDTRITLSSGVLAIAKRLTIDGGSHAVTVSGNHAVRVFDVGASGLVTLSRLSIVSGTIDSSGSGIYNAGALTVQDCVLSDNVSAENGGGIHNAGALTVQNSVLSGNRAGAGGGAIGNLGALTLQASTLSGNSASYGGGIFNADGGQMTVRVLTCSGNAATGEGGGAIDQWVSSSSVSGAISNSTIVSNTAVNAHTSGIWLESGDLTLHNTIVANNNGANNFHQTGGTFTSQGYNLANAWNGLITTTGDLTADPLLGPLGDYGGGTGGAVTAPLRVNSPAIDAGDPATCPTTDQRGFPRADSRCDIGAFERQFSDAGGDTVVKTGFTGGASYSFGPTMVSMTLAADDAGSITVTKHLTTPGGVWDTGEISVTWWITHNLSASPAVTVSFCYTDTEIGAADENGLRPFRWNDGDWEAFTGSVTVDLVHHCVTALGVSQFSPWTLFDTSGTAEKPTAARVVRLAARGFAPFAAGLCIIGGAVAFKCKRRR